MNDKQVFLTILGGMIFAVIGGVLPMPTRSQQTAKQSEVNSFNVPAELRACLRTKPELEFNGSINPFYISGDYDGDGLTDFAVQVNTRKEQSQGILFCFAKGRTILLGAGAPVTWPQDEKAVWPFDSWTLARKGGKALSVFPRIKFDALELGQADVGGGLLYWNGSKFRWQQEE
jgi:hypothetical protein